MKNLAKVVMMALLATLFVSCAQDPTAEILENPNVYVLQNTPDGIVYEMMDLPTSTSQNNTGNDLAYKNGNSAHTHGDFTGYGGNITVSFSGTQNNGGAHGSAYIEHLYTTLPFPPFTPITPTTAQLTIDTECVTVTGNMATYSGVITASTGSVFPGAGGPDAVGQHVYFRVIDNGQGANAPSDQYVGILFSTGSAQANCGDGLPWFFGGNLDVDNASDKIKVN